MYNDMRKSSNNISQWKGQKLLNYTISTLRMIFHAFDLVASNVWLQYKNEAEELLVPKNNVLDFLHFRFRLAEEMISTTLHNPPAKKNKVGRPTKFSYSSESPTSSSLLPPLYSPINRTDTSLPLDVSRYDSSDHMPKIDYLQNATKCKNPTSSRNNRTHFYCIKCNVHLCLTKERNCFAEFHKIN
ncbi:hypothetical protein QTP88_010572 [Uroleucon formosanum]